MYLAVGGEGKITVNSKSYDLKDGVGFVLTPDFDFKLTSTGKAPLAFYVREEPIPANFKANPDFAVVSRWDNDRRVGAHWVHTCNGGPTGLNLCTIPPHTMPQPHSHPMEEAWIMVKGETTLSLGKNLRRMTPGAGVPYPSDGRHRTQQYKLVRRAGRNDLYGTPLARRKRRWTTSWSPRGSSRWWCGWATGRSTRWTTGNGLRKA